MPLDLQKIHQLAKPMYVGGKWRATMSRREVGVVKKLALIAGAPWQDPPSMITRPRPITIINRIGSKDSRRAAQRYCLQKIFSGSLSNTFRA